MAEKICEHCAMKIPKAARICPYCRKKQGMSFGLGCLLVIAIGILLGVSISTYNKLTDKNVATNTSMQVSALEEGFYLDAGQEHLIVADSEKILDEWIKAGIRGDTNGQIALMATDHIKIPFRFTRISIAHVGSFKAEIEFLDGNFKGQSGWTMANFIKKGIPK